MAHISVTWLSERWEQYDIQLSVTATMGNFKLLHYILMDEEKLWQNNGANIVHKNNLDACLFLISIYKKPSIQLIIPNTCMILVMVTNCNCR